MLPPQSDDMFPDLIPTIVQRIFCARDLHFKRKPYATRFTREECSTLLHYESFGRPEWKGLAWSLASIDRARDLFPKLLPWPLTRWTPRPWEQQVVESAPLAELQPDDAVADGEHLLLKAFDEQGKVRIVEAVADFESGMLRLVKHLPPHSAASLVAAAFAAWLVLDGLDGRFDAIVHWCRVFAHIPLFIHL